MIQPIQIIAVTANPVSPFGIKFDQKKFLLRLRDVLKIPVFDVVSGG